KVGLYGVKNELEAEEMIKAVVKAVKDYDDTKRVVIAGYGDFYRINSIDPLKLPSISAKHDADVVMVDTAIKDGTSIFDHMKIEDMRNFVRMAKENGLLCALAGNLSWNHIGTLKELSPDIIGVRTIVCESGRNSKIKRELVRKLKELVS
ncbi:MAG: (5-formylfuran-3-yl)methyl phosphate synthase, partial [Archaeoglobaceae archaeon]